MDDPRTFLPLTSVVFALVSTEDELEWQKVLLVHHVGTNHGEIH